MAGSRDSEWHVLRRCLAILVRLQKGPASSEELIRVVELRESSDSPSLRRLQEDIKRLRGNLRCDIRYARSIDKYVLRRIGVNLLDLPPEAEQGLSFLLANFTHNAPMSYEVQILVESLVRVLAEETSARVKGDAHALMLDLQPKDQGQISNRVWDTVRKAIGSERYLEFDYLSPQHVDGQPRYHYVEPYKLFFSDGHYYLDAYCLRSKTPAGIQERHEFLTFRVERIIKPRVLPQKFVRRFRPRYKLAYELAPYIARAGVTIRFADSHVSMQPDGSAIISTTVEELFRPLRTLLRYGPGCRVIAGTEAVAQMRLLVTEMYEKYAEDQTITLK